MKRCTVHTTGIGSPLLPRDAKQSSMNYLITGVHGAAEAQMDGTLDHPSTIIVVATTLCPRRMHIASLAQRNYFLSTARSPAMRSKHLKGLSDKMVTTLSAMTPSKQRPVLKLICSKLAAKGISSEMAPVHTHPLHEWNYRRTTLNVSPHQTLSSSQNKQWWTSPANKGWLTCTAIKGCHWVFPCNALQMRRPS